MAGQLIINGCPNDTKIEPKIVKKYPLFTNVYNEAPAIYKPAPKTKLNLKPRVSIIWLAGKFMIEYAKKDTVIGAVTYASDMP